MQMMYHSSRHKYLNVIPTGRWFISKYAWDGLVIEVTYTGWFFKKTIWATESEIIEVEDCNVNVL